MSEAPIDSAAPLEPAPPEPAPASRRSGPAILAAAAAVLTAVVVLIAASPFWAPAVMPALPWGDSTPQSKPKPSPPAPPTQAAAPAADPAIAALRTQAAQNAAALQVLGQQVAALVAKPAPDLAPLQQQVASLAASAAELTQKVAALDKAAQHAPNSGAALTLVLLQIEEAIEAGRPFAAEYQALVALSRDHPDIAKAAEPLAGPATSGVASRAVLIARLHQLAPQIATAAPPAKAGWRSQIVARLRSLVTIRRVDGEGQDPAESAIAASERALASGDLNAAIGELSALSGAKLAAAQPWLAMARQRLAVETALKQIETLLTAELGPAPAASPAKPG
jgi:hypothetical protein